jgi:elongation factor Tu
MKFAPTETKTKPQISIGLLGQDGHGKSTLAAAIYAHLSRENRKVEEGCEITLSIGDCRELPDHPFVYESDNRQNSIYDFAGHINVVKNLILNRIPLDGAILVVSAVDGVTAQMRQQVRLAGAAGVICIVVFLNKCDLSDDTELLDLVELEVREMLAAYGCAADSQVIRGSAGVVLNKQTMSDSETWNDKIRELLHVIDAAIPNPIDIKQLPFLMQIEDIFTITGRGTVVTGYVERGTHHINTPVEIIGFGPSRITIATDMEQRRTRGAVICAGENAGVMLQDICCTDVQRGHVLADPGTIQAYSRFRAELYYGTREESIYRLDRSKPFCTFRVRTVVANGTMQLDDPNIPLRGGNVVEITGELEAPVALERGVRFTVLAAGRPVAFGIVTDVLT